MSLPPRSSIEPRWTIRKAFGALRVCSCLSPVFHTYLQIEVSHVHRRVLVAVRRLLPEQVRPSTRGDAPTGDSHSRHRARRCESLKFGKCSPVSVFPRSTDRQWFWAAAAADRCFPSALGHTHTRFPPCVQRLPVSYSRAPWSKTRASLSFVDVAAPTPGSGACHRQT